MVIHRVSVKASRPQRAAETAIAGGLDAAERDLRFIAHRRAVDVADAGFDALGDRHRAHDVAAENGGGKSIFGVVGDAHGFVDALDADDRFHRPEALFRIDAHRRIDAVEQSRFDDGAVALAAAGEHRALGGRILDQRIHPLGRGAIEQRAEHDMGARIAGLQGLRLGREFGDEFIRDRFIDDDAFGRHADLALVHIGAERGGVDRRIDVGVVEDEQRRLAAELQQDGLRDISPPAGR